MVASRFEQGLLPEILEVLLLLALQLLRGIEQHPDPYLLSSAAARGRCPAHPECRRRVAHQPQQVDDLLGALDAEPLTHLGRPPDLWRIAGCPGRYMRTLSVTSWP